MVDRPGNVTRSVWHYNRADFDALNLEFLNAPWATGLIMYDDINDLLGYYYQLINLGMETHIPKRKVNRRKKDKPWMTGYIRHLLLQRNKLNGEFTRDKKLETKIERNRMRALCKKEIRIAKAIYRARQTSQLADPNISVKKYWTAIEFCLPVTIVIIPEVLVTNLITKLYQSCLVAMTSQTMLAGMKFSITGTPNSHVMKEIHGSKIKASIPPLIDDNVTYSTNSEKANLFADYFSEQCSLPPPTA